MGFIKSLVEAFSEPPKNNKSNDKLIQDLINAAEANQPLLAEEYYWLATMYRKGQYGLQPDTDKHRRYAIAAALLGHPSAQLEFLRLFVNRHDCYHWNGAYFPREMTCYNWLRENYAALADKDFRERLCHRGGSDEQYYRYSILNRDANLFQFAYDYMRPDLLAECYASGNGCTYNRALATYWAMEAEHMDEDKYGMLLQQIAPPEARIPNGEEDIIIADEVKQQALQTEDALVRINFLNNQLEHQEILPADFRFLERCAVEGIAWGVRLYLNVSLSAYNRQYDRIPDSKLELFMHFYDLLDKYGFEEVYEQRARLYLHCPQIKDEAKAVEYFRKACMYGTYFEATADSYQAIVDSLQSGRVQLPGDNALHARFFGQVRRIYYGEK